MTVSLPETLQLAPRALQPQLLRALTVGQLLDATVIGRRSENSITLAIGGTRIAAATTADPAPGTRLTLEVIKTGVPVVVRPAPGIGADPAAGQGGNRAPAAPPATAYLRVALPRSAPQSEVLATLSRLAPTDTRAPLAATAARPAAVPGSPTPAATTVTAHPHTAAAQLTGAPARNGVPVPAPAPGAPALPPGVAAEVATLMRALPALQDLGNAQNLARAVRDSGLLLESRLANAVLSAAVSAASGGDTAELGRDYKWLLLRVYQAVRSALPPPGNTARAAAPDAGAAARSPIPGEAAASTDSARLQTVDLQRTVSAGLARIQTLQLTALQGDADPRGLLTVELPVRSADTLDVIELTVEGDAGAESGERGLSVVTVRIPVPGRGTAVARVAMAGDAVSVHLSADDAQLLDDMTRMLSELERRLQRAGLNTGHIGATPLAPDEPQRPPLQLLNISI